MKSTKNQRGGIETDLDDSAPAWGRYLEHRLAAVEMAQEASAAGEAPRLKPAGFVPARSPYPPFEDELEPPPF